MLWNEWNPCWIIYTRKRCEKYFAAPEIYWQSPEKCNLAVPANDTIGSRHAPCRLSNITSLWTQQEKHPSTCSDPRLQSKPHVVPGGGLVYQMDPNGATGIHRNPQESTGIHTIPTQEIPVLSDATWCYPVPTRRSWHKLSSERSHGQQTLESVWVTWEILDSHLKSSHVTMSSLHKSLLLQTKHICQNHPISRVLQSKSAKMQSFWLTSGASAGIAGVVNLERISSICLSTATWLAEQLTLENLGMSWLILGLLGSSWLLAISISSVQFPLLSGSKQYWRTLTDLVDGFEAQQKPCNASGKAALAS